MIGICEFFLVGLDGIGYGSLATVSFSFVVFSVGDSLVLCRGLLFFVVQRRHKPDAGGIIIGF